MSKVKVLTILQDINSGGVERRRLSLFKLSPKQTFEHKVICRFKISNVAREIESQGVDIFSLDGFKGVFDIRKILKVCRYIRQFKPDIIHGAVFEGVILAAICGFLCRVPVIILEETSDPKNRSWRGNILMKFLCLLANKVVGVSPISTDYLQNTIKINRNKISLINNGVAKPRLVSQKEKVTLQNKLGITENDIVIGSVGRMVDDNHKRFSDLIRAFSILQETTPDVKLIIVGDGKEKIKYRQFIADLNLTDKILLPGYVSDVALYYNVFDVFSLLSAHEAFGLVLAEAMYHKLPIVATRVGGMQYIVEDNKTGILVERFNINQIAKALQKLVTDQKLRISMGNKGYERVMEEYTEERYVNEVLTLYSKMARSNK